MNSTGSKLNSQELRNAEYFGHFKNLSYNIAHSQLQRWRDWRIFTEQYIARMEEVELTSELFMFLIDGLFEQTKANIDAYYKKYDNEFVSQRAVVKEFERVMQAIDDHFGHAIADSNYSNRAQFFQIFVLITRLLREKIELSPSRVRRILEIGRRIAERQGLPEEVNLALASRFNRKSNRETVAEFIYANASK